MFQIEFREISCNGVAVEWDIEHMILASSGIRSPPFFISDAQCYLHIYQLYSFGKMFLYLVKELSTSEFHLAYALGIKKADGTILKVSTGNQVFLKEKDQTSRVGLARSEQLDSTAATEQVVKLTVFLFAQVLDRVATANTVDATSQTLSSEGVETLSRNFKDLFLSTRKGDITFKVNDKEFMAHEVVLSARSTVFKAMFEAEMKEKNSGIVEIKDSNPAHFEAFLLFLYSGKIDVVSSENAIGLYYLAEKYNLKELKVACSKCLLTRGISVDSVCDVVRMSSLYDEPQLLDTAINFFVKHANIVLTTPKWFSFLTEHPTLANELLLKMTNEYIK